MAILKVDEGLYRGSKEDALLVRGRAYRSFLNLETETRELICGDPNEEFRHCQDQNIIFFDVAWSGIFPPKKADVYSALGVLMYGVRPLLFHCRAGRERTGFLAACYRMHVQGWSFEDAYKEWVELGCRWPTRWLWKKSLKQYERTK